MSLSREKSKEVCFMKTPIAKMNTTKLADFLTETEKIATEALQLIPIPTSKSLHRMI